MGRFLQAGMRRRRAASSVSTSSRQTCQLCWSNYGRSDALKMTQNKPLCILYQLRLRWEPADMHLPKLLRVVRSSVCNILLCCATSGKKLFESKFLCFSFFNLAIYQLWFAQVIFVRTKMYVQYKTKRRVIVIICSCWFYFKSETPSRCTCAALKPFPRFEPSRNVCLVLSPRTKS